MILFTTIDNIILDGRVHFPHGLKIETFEYSPLATTFKSDISQILGGYYMLNLKKENRVIAYKEFDKDLDTESISAEVTYITYLFSFAWFLKYNTFQIGEVWYFDSNKKVLRKFAEGYTVTVPASMKGKATSFNVADVDDSIRLLEKFLSFNFPIKYEVLHGTINYSKLSILQRAAELIELSKLAPNIYHKIGLLCSTLECLFTTDNFEVNHKVCERVAYFISDNPEERIEIFQKVKKAYGHRSDFFHGNTLKILSDEVYFNFDDIVRRTMLKAITEKSEIFNGKAEMINKYFTELVLGVLNTKDKTA